MIARVLVASIAALAASFAGAQDAASLRVMGFAGSSNWPLFVGVERGLYAREGLAVEFSAARDSTSQLASLADGRIEIALTAFDNVVALGAGEIFAFCGINGGARFSLMVAPGVRTYADLKRRALGVDATANGYALVLLAMLKHGGLRQGDYRLVSVGSSRERFAALRDGRVAGTLLNAPQDAAAAAAGFARLGDSGDVIGRYQGSVGAARRSWAAANAGTLTGFIRATVAAMDWLYEPANRGAAIEVLRRRIPGLTAEVAAQSYDELLHPTRGSLSRRAALDAEGMRTVLALRAEFAPGKPPAGVRLYYDASYHERALSP